MNALLVGYARCSTDQQDLTAQHDALLGLGVAAHRIYVDHDAPRLRARLKVEQQLIDDATAHGWSREIERHEATTRRLEQFLHDLA